MKIQKSNKNSKPGFIFFIHVTIRVKIYMKKNDI